MGGVIECTHIPNSYFSLNKKIFIFAKSFWGILRPKK